MTEQKVITRYVGYFNALRAYHQKTGDERDKLLESFFPILIEKMTDQRVRSRMQIFYNRERQRRLSA